CSTQSVPSLSKVAMRASGGTNFGLALSVVVRTKSTMACLAAVSFQEGNGSSAAAATRKKVNVRLTTNNAHTEMPRSGAFILPPPCKFQHLRLRRGNDRSLYCGENILTRAVHVHPRTVKFSLPFLLYVMQLSIAECRGGGVSTLLKGSA